jgi:DNA-directed RNA polymerase subunit RPC12/RpoP
MGDMRSLHRCKACGAQVTWTDEVGAVLKCAACGGTEFTYVGKAMVNESDETEEEVAASPVACPQCGNRIYESQGAEVVEGKVVFNHCCDQCGHAFTDIPLL